MKDTTTEEATSAITLRNQVESPFLRLPGEIRNKIYDYILGGLIFSSWIGIIIPKPCVSAVSDFNGRRGSCVPLAAILQLLVVCRQINVEARLLPFKSNVFDIDSYELESVLDKLTIEQRDAITTLRLDECVVKNVLPKYTRSFFRSMKRQLFHSGYHTWASMNGLKRIVIWNWRVHEDKRQEELDRKSAKAKIIHYAGDRGIEVVFGSK